jgi:hypothetical protein
MVHGRWSPVSGIALLAACALVGARTASADDLADNIKALKAVRAGGEGNAAASAAWRRIAAADATRLPALLAALDDAEPLAANWIRAAIDAIAERELRAGRALPAKELEAFALDKRHAPRPRRLAYEWLARVDKTAPDRIIPGMLLDPSLEFRRDAVSRLLDRARQLTQGNVEKAAIANVYREALLGARDMDQVREIADRLRGLGQPVDLADHFGFIKQWKLIGPFDNTGGRGFDTAYPPEQKVDLAASYEGKAGPVKWVDFTSEHELAQVDLNKGLGKHMLAAGYAATEFYSPRQQQAEIRITSLCAVKFWLNGKLLAAHEIYHQGTPDAIDHYVAQVALRPGRNEILVKCLQNDQKEDWAQNWDFKLRVCDSVGTAIASQRPATKQPAAAQ